MGRAKSPSSSVLGWRYTFNSQPVCMPLIAFIVFIKYIYVHTKATHSILNIHPEINFKMFSNNNNESTLKTYHHQHNFTLYDLKYKICNTNARSFIFGHTKTQLLLLLQVAVHFSVFTMEQLKKYAKL